MSIIQIIRNWLAKVFSLTDSKSPLLPTELFDELVADIVGDFATRKRGAFVISDAHGEAMEIARQAIDKISLQHPDWITIPVWVSLGGKSDHISLFLMEEMKKSLLLYKDVMGELDTKFISRLDQCATEARQQERIINEKTKQKILQWITSADTRTAQELNVGVNVGLIPQASINVGGKISKEDKEGTQIIKSDIETTRDAHEFNFDNLGEVKTLNDLHNFIEEISKVKILFHYNWIEKIKSELQDPEIKRLQEWFRELQAKLGCLGCFFFPVSFLFEIGLGLTNFTLWLFKPAYLFTRYLLKKAPAVFSSVTGYRKVKLVFILDGVDGENFYKNDAAISTLKSLFRNLHTIFLVFTDHDTYQKLFRN